MADIKAADVAKLRKATGAGMMDCKKALVEANGDFDKAIEEIRKKGQAIANKRADREATEGVVLAKTTDDKKNGAVVVLNCETDFVAINEDFVNFATSILDKAIETKVNTLDELKAVELNGHKIGDLVAEKSGIIGEKIELGGFASVADEMVVPYIHPGNKLATLVAFNKVIDAQAGRDIAMQVAAMSPVSVDKENVPEEVIAKELEIGREQARLDGKPEAMLDKIAQGKLGKFFKENTLMNQMFVKDNKKTIKDYLKSVNPEIKITKFERFTLNA
jgi:elongation factor Ts